MNSDSLYDWRITNCGCDACVRAIAELAKANQQQTKSAGEGNDEIDRGEDAPLKPDMDGAYHASMIKEYDTSGDLFFRDKLIAQYLGGKLTLSQALALQPVWSAMHISHHPLTQRIAGAKGRKNRSTDQGAFFKSPHRLLLDRAVFGHKVRERTASVLLDASGSMNLSSREIDNLLSKFPAAIIAAYCGTNQQGQLHILANNGRRAAKLPRLGNGNLCDGPALDWLAKQSTPRYWVSDAQVTEYNDKHTARAYIQCMAKCQRYGIKRKATIDTLLKEA